MKTRFQLLIFIAGMIALNLTAKKCRQIVGEGSALSKPKQFSCFDRRSGTVACMLKQGVKLYFYNIRPRAHVERSRNPAIWQGKRMIGPTIASGWDFLEAIYYGRTTMEASLRGSGTFFGTYYFGVVGEKKLWRVGYLVGSQIGSWIGGKMGLMVYDLVNRVHYFLGINQAGESNHYDEIEERSNESYELIASESSDEKHDHDPLVGEDLEVHEEL